MDRQRAAAEPAFRVLGAVAVAGAEDAMNSPRLRRLLAGLLIHAGSVVAVDRLAEIVWGDDPPVHVGNALQGLVSRLRATLRAAGIATVADPRLLTRSPGYLLAVDDDELDARRFEQLTGAARAAAPDAAIGLFTEALGLWRGSAYVEFADAPFARAEAARLEELRATARGDHAHALMVLGRHEEAISCLETLTVEHPLSERPHSLLMLALHRAGRTPDALAVFRRMRARLDDELGIEPGAELTDLHTRLLRRDPELDPRHTQAPRDTWTAPPRPQPPSTSHGGNLPQALTRVIGREDAVVQVCDRLRSSRLVTLTGPGGVGKTTLGMAVARTLAATYRDGAWLFELASITRDGDVAHLMTTTLDLPQQDSGSALDRLIDALEAMQALVVIDNCEHVIDGAAAVVAAVVRRCADITVLSTSRQPLGVAGEQLWPVPPLALEPAEADRGDGAVPAVRLFAERASAVAPAFAVTDDNAADVAELCRRLDGLPLAIELAAMRMPAMTAAEVIERLPLRLQFLRSTNRLTEERHQTLRAVIDWSYDALDRVEQRCFEAVSVFSGSFTATAAEEVTGRVGLDAAHTVDLLGSLVDKSLLSARPARPATRYALLETLRDYGLQRLEERDALQPARAAHAAHWLAFTEQMATRLCTRDQNQAVDAITREIAELRSAHAWALQHDLDLALRFMPALIGYAELRMSAELSTWAERTIAAAQRRGVETPDVATAHALVAAGARVAGDLAAARRHIDQALRHDARDAAFAHHHALYLLSDVSLFEGRLADVHAFGRRRRSLPEAPGGRWVTMQSLLNEALAHAYGGDVDAALAMADAMRATVGPDDPPDVAAYAPFVAGEALMDRDPVRASALMEESLALAREGRDRLMVGVAMVSAASLRLRLDEPGPALALFREAVTHWRQLGIRTMLWTTLRNVVALLSTLDATADAAVLLGVVRTRATAAPIYGADQDRLDTLEQVLRARLGAGPYARAAARGAGMSDDEALRFVASALAGVSA
jgi:predicted ATPase/DNA-binding SARP family transcriptional activator